MFRHTWILAIVPLAFVHCGGSGGGGAALVSCEELCDLTIACGLVDGLDTATCLEGCSGDTDGHQGGSDCHAIAGGNDCAAFGQCLSEILGGEESGEEESGEEETGGEGVDCDAYCADVGECAEKWDTTPDVVFNGCLDGCTESSAEEQASVAACLDASSSCDDTYACILDPDDDPPAVDCDAYCSTVSECAEEWETTPGDVLDSCLDGCTEAPAEEQLEVATCLDASSNCDQIFACVPE